MLEKPNFNKACRTCFGQLPAATVFRDALAVSIYDEDHSDTEERWVTLGRAENGQLLVVIHTYHTASPTEAVIRIISSRPATKHEQRQYEQGT